MTPTPRPKHRPTETPFHRPPAPPKNRNTEEPKHRPSAPSPIIHPILVYPFKPAQDYTDLQALYTWVAELAANPEVYARPITVFDRKTLLSHHKNKKFEKFRERIVAKSSDIIDAWCVDTCQMWYVGLGAAFEKGAPGDVYWLIPGDFNYGTPVGREVLTRLHDLPEIIIDLDQDLCIGEIATDHCNSKQLIDTYGTFALLYTWFPKEAQEIRRFTERPRSEFFALRHSFLREIFAQRWYPYEQTMVVLLQAIFSAKRISRFFVGNISDLPEGVDTLDAAMQQIERTERVLKSLWRERFQSQPGWMPLYSELGAQSDHVRRTAFTILKNLLP
jgi:hypothetical protein